MIHSSRFEWDQVFIAFDNNGHPSEDGRPANCLLSTLSADAAAAGNG